MRTFFCAVTTSVCLSIAGAPARAQSGGGVLTLDAAIATAVGANRELQMSGLDEQRAADDLAALQTRRRPAFDLKALEGGFLSPVQF